MEMITLTIDGKCVTVPKGTTVYHAAQSIGTTLPIFCYHDRMAPFGACRVCLVEVEKMPKLQTSCTLVATEGMVVRTASEHAVEGRKGILELLLINHPLDCPICDRGGECALQEFALEHGPGQSRFYEEKRKFTKGVPLGPVLTLDRERCIVCARCTRFGDLVAGDSALQFIERGYKTEVGTVNGAPVESKFIGNTIMLCPVGALTSQVYRFRARPWDNASVETSCTLCPVGCSMALDSRDGEVMRTRSKCDPEVNDVWLCDKGWFGYEYSASDERLTHPMVRRNGTLEKASWEEALDLIAVKMKDAIPSGELAAFGGDALLTEEAFLLQELMRKCCGVSNLDHRIGEPLFAIDEEGLPPGMECSPGSCEELSYALLLGCDITEEMPLLWLRLKQAINKGCKVYYSGHYAPEIAPHLTDVRLHAPGFELDHLPPKDLQGRGAVFVGSQYLRLPYRGELLASLQKIYAGLSFNVLEGSGNSMGLRLAGMRPDIGPLDAPLEKRGLNAKQVLEQASQSGWKFLYVAGCNPKAKTSEVVWAKAKDKLAFLVVQDLFLTETAKDADVVLPVLSVHERDGTFINIEGRLRKVRSGKQIPEGVLSDGEIFKLLARRLGSPIAVDESFRKKLKEPIVRHKQVKSVQKTTAKSVASNQLKATFAPALFDRGVRMKRDEHLLKLVKQPTIRIAPEEASKRNLIHGSAVTVQGKTGKVCGPLQVDEGVALGTVVLPLGFETIFVYNLDSELYNGIEVDVH